jgi:DNA-binding beta-propeller fold protein YncE
VRELERRFPDTLAVVGVHSGKYVAERVTARIREASLRLGAADHPVVNDRQFRVWRSYAVRAWPTVVVIDARGYVVGQHAGEFTADALAPAIERLVADAERAGILAREPLPHEPEAPAIAPGVLRYPGKVAVDGRRLAVADSGHHRVLVGTIEADGRRLRVTHIAGTGEPGLRDGPLDEARFTMPQGLAFDGDRLFVADAGSHAVRVVELVSDGAGTVRTLAGTGSRVRTAADRRAGAMASPWDVALHEGTLYVAMAGTHQIWALDPATGRARVHAGQGGEDIADDALERALLAQPMGIAARGDRLVFADAETSAVRWADAAPGGRVGTWVGTGLFDFGDVDGSGDDVRLEHAQHVAVHERTGRVLVVDSYNDALKWLDPTTRSVETWVRGLHEPAGAAFGDGVVYVADTNAHRIAVVDERTGGIGEVEVVLP